MIRMAQMNTWRQRYEQLLALANVSPELLQANCSIPITTGKGIRLSDCLAQPQLLKAAMQRQAGATTGPRELRVHASVLHQNLALAIMAPLTLRLFLEGETVLPEASALWVQPTNAEHPWQLEDTGPLTDTAGFITGMAERARAWYPLFRQTLGVSPGAYWSSIGLAFCAPYSALYNTAPQEQLCAEASAWLAQFDCDARHFIEWIPVESGAERWAIPQRRGCCLKYKLPERGYCGTCGIHRKERLAALTPVPQKASGYWSPAS